MEGVNSFIGAAPSKAASDAIIHYRKIMEAYARAVVSGEIAACNWIGLACSQTLSDIGGYAMKCWLRWRALRLRTKSKRAVRKQFCSSAPIKKSQIRADFFMVGN